MKKSAVLLILIISLLILISCNLKKETPPPQKDIISEAPVVETEKADPGQSWKESLLSSKAIETEKDIESIKLIIEKAIEDNKLDELQTFLETEAEKDKVAPQILFSLSLVYGRKGLVKEEYKTIEKLEKQVKQRPGIAFNLSLVYGRKETLKSQIDKAEAKALALLQGFISVASDPEGAEVYLDGVLKGTTPFTTKGLEKGSYSVEIQKENYTVANKTVNVKAGKTTGITEKLTLIPGSLVINSDPEGATVLLEGEELGITPLEIPEIEAGIYELQLEKKDYEGKLLSVIISPGVIKNSDIRLTAITGNIYINSLTEGAKVFQDGKRVYPQTGWLKNIPTGHHYIVIKKENYKDKNYNINIKSNQTEYISGFFIFLIPYAEIKVDGKLADWEGIEPAFIDSIGDKKNNVSGTDITKAFLAKNDTYLYLRMDFADGKPSAMKEMIYECVVWADIIPSGGQYFIEIRLQGNSSNQLKPFISIRKLKGNQNTNVSWVEKGYFRLGNSFFEARFPLSVFKKYISNESSYKTEIRSWRGGSWDESYDTIEKKLITFFSE